MYNGCVATQDERSNKPNLICVNCGMSMPYGSIPGYEQMYTVPEGYPLPADCPHKGERTMQDPTPIPRGASAPGQRTTYTDATERRERGGEAPASVVEDPGSSAPPVGFELPAIERPTKPPKKRSLWESINPWRSRS